MAGPAAPRHPPRGARWAAAGGGDPGARPQLGILAGACGTRHPRRPRCSMGSSRWRCPGARPQQLGDPGRGLRHPGTPAPPVLDGQQPVAVPPELVRNWGSWPGPAGTGTPAPVLDGQQPVAVTPELVRNWGGLAGACGTPAPRRPVLDGQQPVAVPPGARPQLGILAEPGGLLAAWCPGSRARGEDLLSLNFCLWHSITPRYRRTAWAIAGAHTGLLCSLPSCQSVLKPYQGQAAPETRSSV